MKDLPKHDIALGWHRIRRQSLVAGRDEMLRIAKTAPSKDYWAQQIADQDALIANLDNSTEVLMADGGYLKTAAAIDDGTVVTGTIVSDERTEADLTVTHCCYCGNHVSAWDQPCQSSPDRSHWRSQSAYAYHH